VSKHSKSLERLKARPKDFTWDELVTLLKHFGYQEVSGNGSRRKFISKATNHKFTLHKPHPQNTVKSYVIDIALKALIENGLIEENQYE
jgi:hypothetical protein